MVRFQGTPSTSIDQLVLKEAVAVTPFRNQKGIVRVEHEGRLVQLSAELTEADAILEVKVGDRLLIETVDPAKQRVTVSVV
jgi:hypothetical protein